MEGGSGKRAGCAGEVTVNLLERMLVFDPARRCTAEEALAHEYLEGISADIPLNGPPLLWTSQASALPRKLPMLLPNLWASQASQASALPRKLAVALLLPGPLTIAPARSLVYGVCLMRHSLGS